jgi:hypothetical protein
MTGKKILGTVAFFTLLLSASLARAGYEAVAGQNCVPGFSGHTGDVFYDWGGIANQSTADITVWCPVDTDARPTKSQIIIHAGTPQNGSMTACYVAAYSSNQTGNWSTSKAPCGTSGGCNLGSGATFFNGVDFTLTWNTPLPSTSNTVSIGYGCVLPTSQNGNLSTFSWIYGTKNWW